MKDILTPPSALWVATFLTRLVRENGYAAPKLISGHRYACLRPYMFTTAIITGPIGDLEAFEDRWCYETAAEARAALEAWDGTGEPEGWHRHPMSGRRRSKGDGTEYDENNQLIEEAGVIYGRR